VDSAGVHCAEDLLSAADAALLGPAPRVATSVRGGVTTAEAPCVKELEREVKGLSRANEILKTASAFFARKELDR
jgi:transposase-like protein